MEITKSFQEKEENFAHYLSRLDFQLTQATIQESLRRERTAKEKAIAAKETALASVEKLRQQLLAAGIEPQS